MSERFRLRHPGRSVKAVRLCLPGGDGVNVPRLGCYPPVGDPPLTEMTSQMEGLVALGVLRKEVVRDVPSTLPAPPNDEQE